MAENTAEKNPQENNRKSKPQPSTGKQGISNHNPSEENARQAKVILFPEQRETKKKTKDERK